MQTVRRSEVEALAIGLMRQHGLERWQFAFNRRKRSLGLCRYTLRRIELSSHFALAHDEVEVRDVILHEIAHALAGHAAAHGPRWKSICQTIGARPERCSVARMPPGRWRATCPACSDEFSRFRRPMRNRVYSCPKCGPANGKLSFRTNP
jgi:predicted SprT family Zn-dependent metalloprotease